MKQKLCLIQSDGVSAAFSSAGVHRATARKEKPPETLRSFTQPASLSPSGVHVFGLLATALVTDVIQLATGYHAPFFLTVCQPNYTAPGVSCDNNAYITRDICMGKDQYAIMSAR